jgi:hypothetical protein
MTEIALFIITLSFMETLRLVWLNIMKGGIGGDILILIVNAG